MEATLDIDPQDGDLDFIEEIQRVCDVRLEQRHVAEWRTLGDIHTTLLALRSEGPTEGRCPTMMAFHKLRAALAEGGEDRGRLVPSTDLEALADGRSRLLLAKLRLATKLRLPSARLRAVGSIGAALISIAIVVGLAFLLKGNLLVAALSMVVLLIGCLLAYADPGALPEGVRTLGDLARSAAGLSRAELRASGARRMPGEEWSVLAAIAAEESGLEARSLEPKTYLFRHVYEKDRLASASV